MAEVVAAVVVAIGLVVACGAPAPASSSTASSASGGTATPSSAGTPPDQSPIASAGPSDGTAILVGAGDIASCGSGGDEATADLLDGIEGTVFTAGDNVYERGTPDEFAECYELSWGRHRARTLPVPGNHDYGTDGAAGYFAYFGAAAGDPSQGWYATDVGAWRFYALNSNCGAIGGCGPGSAQEAWLRADLAANPRACALAVWHHARFSSAEHGNDEVAIALWRALQDGGAEIVVSGHDHSYERFAAQDASGAADPDGIVGYVAGTGGRSLYDFGTPVANSLVRDNTAFGVLQLELRADGWTSNFLPAAGADFTDVSSGTCH